MSSFTFADNRFGGRLQTATDAIAAGHLRRAAGILNEIAGELNAEAEQTDGLMADAPAKLSVGDEEALQMMTTKPPAEPVSQPDSMDLQSCARGAHSFGPADPISGWSTCSVCGQVLVTPPR